ncbi:MAG: hypothetical protein QM760_04065 [Nibricoccus sp.]
MNFSELLKSRQSLLRQAHLANLAFSYATLRRLGDHVEKARLQGRVRLRPADEEEDATPASLTALDGSQAVIEEHFSDEDIYHLADSIAFALETPFSEIELRLEDIGDKFGGALRNELDEAGVVMDHSEIMENNPSHIQEDENSG